MQQYDAERWANRYYARAGVVLKMDAMVRGLPICSDWSAKEAEDSLATSKASAGRFMDHVRR